MEPMKLDLTIEQITALRVMLKMEIVEQLETFLRLCDDEKAHPIARLNGTMRIASIWNSVDQTLNHPVVSVMSDSNTLANLTLDTIINVKLIEADFHSIRKIVLSGNWIRILDLTKKEEGVDKHNRMLPLVVIERNASALRLMFKEDKEVEFTFPQKAPGTVQ